ncbi:MAG: VIT domain-containing protein [Polyangiaceae bacterium]
MTEPRAGGKAPAEPLGSAGAPGTHLEIVVSRGDRFDVAQWTPVSGEAWPGAAAAPEAKRGLDGPRLFTVVASLLVIIGTVVMVKTWRPGLAQPLVPTVADLSAVHAGVSAGGQDVRRLTRLRLGDMVETDADGRARLRLDDGTVLLVDRNTRLRLTEGGAELEHGRLFVQGAVGAKTAVTVGGATGVVSGAQAGVERSKDGKARLYAASGELTVRTGNSDKSVRTGETAQISGAEVTVAPERAFDDWTGGMAAPWAAKGAPRRAVGELWGRGQAPGDAGSPLTIRAHDVRATIYREVAETEVSTTYFNAGSNAVAGDYRMAIPPGAVVSRFAVGQTGAMREGKVVLAARSGSAIRPTQGILEWAGDGWLRGALPTIASGATVTVVVSYIEWMTPAKQEHGPNLLVQYRYPMAAAQAPPLIGEFSARVDASPSNPVSMASGLCGRASGQTVELRRPDFRPTADLVVDVVIEPFTAPARAYVAPAADGDEAGAMLVVRTEAPAAAREDGVTLALVVDTSSSIEPSLLDAERAVVDAVLAGLGTRDRAVVLAADQMVSAVGPATIGPVDDARRKAVSEALGRLSPGARRTSAAPWRPRRTLCPPMRPRRWWSTSATAGRRSATAAWTPSTRAWRDAAAAPRAWARWRWARSPTATC